MNGRPIGNLPQGVTGISIDIRGITPGEAFFAIGSGLDRVAAAGQELFDQPANAGVVVDVQNPTRLMHQASASGTWITDRNRPSCRMASEKLS